MTSDNMGNGHFFIRLDTANVGSTHYTRALSSSSSTLGRYLKTRVGTGYYLGSMTSITSLQGPNTFTNAIGFIMSMD